MPIMTVYFAAPGTPLAHGGTSTPGHMWFSLSNDGMTENSYGFAPINHGVFSGGGKVFDSDLDNYSSYAYKKSIFITQAQYDAVKKFAEDPVSKNFSMNYDAFQNSCVDFVYEALKTFSNTHWKLPGSLVPYGQYPG